MTSSEKATCGGFEYCKITSKIIAAATNWFFPSRKQLSCCRCSTNGNLLCSRRLDRARKSNSSWVVESLRTSSLQIENRSWWPCIQTPLQCSVGLYRASKALLGRPFTLGQRNFDWSMPSAMQQSKDDDKEVVNLQISWDWYTTTHWEFDFSSLVQFIDPRQASKQHQIINIRKLWSWKMSRETVHHRYGYHLKGPAPNIPIVKCEGQI